jgi:hypothetical protein
VTARGGAVRPHAVHPVYVRRPDPEIARERAGTASGPSVAGRAP